MNTTDDVGNCVFNAYNTFITGLRALDSSQSIAELRETPQLFNIWSRRRGLPSNLVNGFLNYSFGWRPVISDLRAISHELRNFPATVRKRLKRIGTEKVTRHFAFDLSSTVQSTSGTYAQGGTIPNPGSYLRRWDTDSSKSKRKVVVTIRASVKPKLQGSAQDTLNKLGALGLIPSLATVWAVTRYSFIVDWFFNIGGAIENLQGSLTHDISNVEICVTDTRERTVRIFWDVGWSHTDRQTGEERQRSFVRSIPNSVEPFLPALKLPHSVMQYVLLGLIAINNTDQGRKLLRSADRYANLLDRRLDRLDRNLGIYLAGKFPLLTAFR
jgi:hypothetical protein